MLRPCFRGLLFACGSLACGAARPTSGPSSGSALVVPPAPVPPGAAGASEREHDRCPPTFALRACELYKRGSYREADEALRDELAKEPAAERRAELWFVRGLVASTRASNPDAGRGAYAASYEIHPSDRALSALGGKSCIVEANAVAPGVSDARMETAPRLSALAPVHAGCELRSAKRVTDATPLPALCTTRDDIAERTFLLVSVGSRPRAIELGASFIISGRTAETVSELVPTSAGWVQATLSMNELQEESQEMPSENGAPPVVTRGMINAFATERIAIVNTKNGLTYFADHVRPTLASERGGPHATFQPSAGGLRVDGLGCHAVLAQGADVSPP